MCITFVHIYKIIACFTYNYVPILRYVCYWGLSLSSPLFLLTNQWLIIFSSLILVNTESCLCLVSLFKFESMDVDKLTPIWVIDKEVLERGRWDTGANTVNNSSAIHSLNLRGYMSWGKEKEGWCGQTSL